VKQLLSDFVSLFFGQPEEGEQHRWPVILGILIFFLFLFGMLAISG